MKIAIILVVVISLYSCIGAPTQKNNDDPRINEPPTEAPTKKIDVDPKITEPPTKDSKLLETVTKGLMVRRPPRTQHDFRNKTRMFRYLHKFGYVKRDNMTDLESWEFKEAIKKLQKIGGLPQTGKIDNSTNDLLNTPRCDISDDNLLNGTTTRSKRFAVYPWKWASRNLNYKIWNSPYYGNMNSAKVASKVALAFNDWTSVSNMNIGPSYGSTGNINIGFYSYNHGDGYSFDGTLGTLAHSFYPADGRSHFDNSETWTADIYPTGTQIDFRQVATHEFGHLLGLMHSSVPGAVMYPYYTYRNYFQLHPDDIAGIRYLYGTRVYG